MLNIDDRADVFVEFLMLCVFFSSFDVIRIRKVMKKEGKKQGIARCDARASRLIMFLGFVLCDVWKSGRELLLNE